MVLSALRLKLLGNSVHSSVFKESRLDRGIKQEVWSLDIFRFFLLLKRIFFLCCETFSVAQTIIIIMFGVFYQKVRSSLLCRSRVNPRKNELPHTFASVQLIECLFLYFVCMSEVLSWLYMMTMRCLRDYNLHSFLFHTKCCHYSKLPVYFMYFISFPDT